MRQNGVVTRLLDKGRAEVSVARGTACGGHCAACDACVYESRLLVEAENAICAQPGERVILESETRRVLGAAVLVYLTPLALFFLGYAIGAALDLKQGLCIGLSLLGAVAGSGLAVLLGRRRKAIDFRITAYER